MQTMIDFTSWFLSAIPDFLWAEPIRYLWGLLLLGYIFRIILDFRSY